MKKIICLLSNKGREDIIRAQVKTATKNIKFTGGTRGGVDRYYKSGVKEYTQSPKTSDVIIGLHSIGKDSFELFFVPTIVVERLSQKSISLNRISALKNNYDILENCKNKDYAINKCKEYGII